MIGNRETRTVGALALLVALTITATAWHFSKRQSALEDVLYSDLRGLNVELALSAERIDRNELPDSVSKIISDCRGRDRFETLLSALASLQSKELSELSYLFDACGDYPSLVKRLSLDIFSRQLKAFEMTYSHIETLTGEPVLDESLLTEWQEIYALEQERSSLFREQVQLQRSIIEVLIVKGSTSNDLPPLIERAKAIAQALGELNQTVDTARAAISTQTP